jgi:hypothetical protein
MRANLQHEGVLRLQERTNRLVGEAALAALEAGASEVEVRPEIGAARSVRVAASGTGPGLEGDLARLGAVRREGGAWVVQAPSASPSGEADRR